MSKKAVFNVQIDEGVLGYIQSLIFELEGLRALVCQLTRSGDGGGRGYEHILSAYQAAHKKYQVAYQELVKALAPDFLNPEYISEISFLTGELIVYREGAI